VYKTAAKNFQKLMKCLGEGITKYLVKQASLRLNANKYFEGQGREIISLVAGVKACIIFR
jgi:hypothetical protein